MRLNKYSAWGVAIMIAAVAAFVVPLPAKVSYCKICGAEDVTRGFQFRFISLRVGRWHEVRATPFSEMLEQKHLVAAHVHLWQAPRLVPDPLNEFGPPVVESLAFLNAPRVIHFLSNVADYADPVSVAKWKEIVLQPEYARVMDASLRFLRVPENGFADRAAFLAWWGGHSYAVYNRLREVTEPD